MELQKKFEELIGLSDLNVVYTDDSDNSLEKETIALAKECAKLCLEEQIKVFNYLLYYIQGATEEMIYDCISKYQTELQQQLKQLEDESME